MIEYDGQIININKMIAEYNFITTSMKDIKNENGSFIDRDYLLLGRNALTEEWQTILKVKTIDQYRSLLSFLKTKIECYV